MMASEEHQQSLNNNDQKAPKQSPAAASQECESKQQMNKDTDENVNNLPDAAIVKEGDD